MVLLVLYAMVFNKLFGFLGILSCNQIQVAMHKYWVRDRVKLVAVLVKRAFNPFSQAAVRLFNRIRKVLGVTAVLGIGKERFTHQNKSNIKKAAEEERAGGVHRYVWMLPV